MTSSLSAYWAGVGTVVIALAGGFGGGIFVADRLSSSSAVPAPGKSRLAEVTADSERPKPVNAEMAERAAPPENHPIISPAAPIASKPAMPDAPPKVPVVKPVPHRVTEPIAATAIAAIQNASQPKQARIKHLASERAHNKAKVAAKSERFVGSERVRVNSTNRAETSEALRERTQKEKKNSEKVQIRRIERGGVRYVVRTRDDRQVSEAEVEKLTAILRSRSSDHAEREAPRLSYQQERRDPFGHLFRE